MEGGKLEMEVGKSYKKCWESRKMTLPPQKNMPVTPLIQLMIKMGSKQILHDLLQNMLNLSYARGAVPLLFKKRNKNKNKKHLKY